MTLTVLDMALHGALHGLPHSPSKWVSTISLLSVLHMLQERTQSLAGRWLNYQLYHRLMEGGEAQLSVKHLVTEWVKQQLLHHGGLAACVQMRVPKGVDVSNMGCWLPRPDLPGQPPPPPFTGQQLLDLCTCTHRLQPTEHVRRDGTVRLGHPRVGVRIKKVCNAPFSRLQLAVSWSYAVCSHARHCPAVSHHIVDLQGWQRLQTKICDV